MRYGYTGADLTQAIDATGVAETYEYDGLHHLVRGTDKRGKDWLERQNREHRAWLSDLRATDGSELGPTCAQMRQAFNELGWRTAAAAWASCTMPVVDRDELREEVEERRRKLEEAGVARSGHPGLAERLAIEAALMNRGLLRLTKGGWCSSH